MRCIPAQHLIWSAASAKPTVYKPDDKGEWIEGTQHTGNERKRKWQLSPPSAETADQHHDTDAKHDDRQMKHEEYKDSAVINEKNRCYNADYG